MPATLFSFLFRIPKKNLWQFSCDISNFKCDVRRWSFCFYWISYCENAENMLIFPDTEMQNANMYPKYVFFLIALEQMLPTFRKAFPTFFFILQYCIKGLVPWVITLTWEILLGVSSKNFVQKSKIVSSIFFKIKTNTELSFYSDQLPKVRQCTI